MKFFQLILRAFVIVFALCFLGACSHSKEAARAHALQNILDSLSKEEMGALELLFRTLLAESQGGYVLYGQKPVCVEAFPHKEEGSIFLAKSIHIFGTKLKVGCLLWKKLNLNQYCKNFALLVSDRSIFDKWSEVALINKKEFLKVVDDHAILFQYVLGPKATSRTLMDQIMDPASSFYDTLQHNQCLVGIILGYGAQNALMEFRREMIESAKTFPTFGFQTLEEEVSWLKNKEMISTYLCPMTLPLIPRFACYEKRETQTLVKEYEKVQREISKELHSKLFLEHVFSRIFETNLRVKPSRQSRPLFPEKIALIQAVAEGIWHCIDELDSEYVQAFYSGMEAVEQGGSPLSEDDYRCLVQSFLETKNSSTRRNLAYHAGMRTWNHFQHGRQFYSYEDIKSALTAIQAKGTEKQPLSSATDELLATLHMLIYREP